MTGTRNTITRKLLRYAVILPVSALFSFIGWIIGQELRGSSAAPFALAIGLIAVGATWWWTKKPQ